MRMVRFCILSRWVQHEAFAGKGERARTLRCRALPSANDSPSQTGGHNGAVLAIMRWSIERAAMQGQIASPAQSAAQASSRPRFPPRDPDRLLHRRFPVCQSATRPGLKRPFHSLKFATEVANLIDFACWVEILNQRVAGSSPATPTNEIKYLVQISVTQKARCVTPA